jgi:tRNA nucleotidyltransferase (CCA-adding enzyme)
LEDLKDKIIRTPLEPKETFLDDPLRVLRVVRFASRFNFSILKQIEETIQLPEIKVMHSNLSISNSNFNYFRTL